MKPIKYRTLGALLIFAGALGALSSEPSYAGQPGDEAKLARAQERAKHFAEIDTNHDKRIWREEFLAHYKLSPASPLSAHDIRGKRMVEAFQSMDANKDGAVTEDEFSAYMLQQGF